MDIDFPTLARLLSQPIIAVEVALPASLNRKWPWPTNVRTNLAAIRTEEGTLLFHYGLVADSLLTGIFEDHRSAASGRQLTVWFSFSRRDCGPHAPS